MEIQFPVIAVLLTCYNRKDKTLKCLESVFNQYGLKEEYDIQVYLVDDNSIDGTLNAVVKEFPTVKVIQGNGRLFWAGGMRTAWQYSIDSGKIYDFFLLINDDTILFQNTVYDLINDLILINDKFSILIGTTIDPITNKITYGGDYLLNGYNLKSKRLVPNNRSTQLCHLGNANVMLVSKEVYNKIGLLSDLYTHGIADYDYTLRARRVGIKSYIGSKIAGTCMFGAWPNWQANVGLRERIKFLYSIKGLAYKEYLKFIRLYFPLYLPQVWLQLWLKTIFPKLWGKFKN